MQRFKNILVVLDLNNKNDALIDRAITLSKRNRARLMIVIVTEEKPSDIKTSIEEESVEIDAPFIDIIETMPSDIPEPAYSYPTDVPISTRDTQESISADSDLSVRRKSSMVFQEEIINAEDQQLDQVVASLRQQNIQVSGKVLYGTPFIEIIREVLKGKYDLVMISAEGRTRVKEMFFGRTSLHLMRKCPCPVWVINPNQPRHYINILAAVDPTPFDQERSELNIKIMDLATSLALREQCELHIIHTWTYFLEDHILSGRVKVSQNTFDEWSTNLKNERKRSLSALLGKYNLDELQSQVYLLKGEAEVLIPKLAKAKNVELIVMGTVCRTGIAGFFIGNTAEKVLSQVDCSVLTIKPDGFITPVSFE